MGKKMICIAAMLMFTGGCVQKQESDQGIAGKLAINVNADKFFDLEKDTSKKDKEKSKEEKISESTKNETEEKQTANSNQSATAKQPTEKNSTSKQSDTSQATQPSQSNENKVNNEDSKHSSSSSSQEQPKQDIIKPSEETVKPVEPAVPEPPIPACDDTIPNGAYTDEAQMDREAQQKVMDNILSGQAVSGYDVEYGYTECGTRYSIPNYY